MSDTYFIADLHAGHKNILTYEAEARPFDNIAQHDAVLVERWNTRVGDDDVVWVLGDMFWTREAADRILPKLRGRVRLVLGDHESRWFKPELAGRFEQIHGQTRFTGGVLVTHVPAFEPHHQKYTKIIHGHLHSDVVPVDARRPTVEHPAYACVSAEHLGLTPIRWDELRRRKGW